MSIPALVMKNRATYLEVAPQFEKEFGVKLLHFWDMLGGFDIIKFDDEVVRSGSGQCREAIARRFGKPAVKVVERLLEMQSEVGHA